MGVEQLLNSKTINVKDFVEINNVQIQPWENPDISMIRNSLIYVSTFELILLAPSLQSSPIAQERANSLVNVLKKFRGGSDFTKLMYLADIKSLTGKLDLSVFRLSQNKFNKTIKEQLEFIEDKNNQSLVTPFSNLELNIRNLVEDKSMDPALDIVSVVHNCILKINNFEDQVNDMLNYEHKSDSSDNENDERYLALHNKLSFLAMLFIADQGIINRADILKSKIYNSALNLLRELPLTSRKSRLINIIAYLKIFNAQDFDFNTNGLSLIMENSFLKVSLSPLPQIRRF